MDRVHTLNPHIRGRSVFFSPNLCLVGTLGDYAPQQNVSVTFPSMNQYDPAYPDCTYLTNSQPADNSSQTVKYQFDTTAYYRLVILRVDIENTAPRDTDDIQVQHFTESAGTFN